MQCSARALTHETSHELLATRALLAPPAEEEGRLDVREATRRRRTRVPRERLDHRVDDVLHPFVRPLVVRYSQFDSAAIQ